MTIHTDDPWDGIEPDAMQARLAACAARVVLIGMPTSRHSSHLEAAAGAPQQIAALLQRDEGNPWAEDGIDLSDPAMLADLGALRVDTEDDQTRLRAVSDAVAQASSMRPASSPTPRPAPAPSCPGSSRTSSTPSSSAASSPTVS